MDFLILIITTCYILSTAGYIAYFFAQKEYLHQNGFRLMLIGFLFHSGAIGFAYMKSGHMPVHSLHGTLLVSGWAVAGAFLILRYRFNLKILGIYAASLSAITMIAASRLPSHPVEVKSILSSFWLLCHIITIFLGEASFALACGVGIMYLVQENAIKTKKHRFIFKRLPSLDLLDNVGYSCLVAGFTLLTIGLITGIVYAKLVWGRFWAWDPKEVWSGISWLLYAALLHQRLTMGWRGRRAAIMAIIGFTVLLFTFFGVNFFMEGHHAEFTRM